MSSTEEGRAEVNKLVSQNWRYLGGEYNASNQAPFNQWTRYCEARLLNPQTFTPAKHKDKCICGQDITFNCWIGKETADGKIKVKVVGSHCIDKFVLNRQVCAECDEPHNSNKYDLCKSCLKKKKQREKYRRTNCLNCNKRINLKPEQNFTYCYSCNKNH